MSYLTTIFAFIFIIFISTSTVQNGGGGGDSIIISTDLISFQNATFWALFVGAVLAFVLGFGMGANDVSNAFGTSVGSKVLTLKQAYILASIFETLGAIFVGYNVTDTMRKSVVVLSEYADNPKALLFGQIAILGGCSGWLMIATFAELPVSTTHSVVGATIGFSFMMKGISSIQWWEVGKIALSWFTSPLLSGFISSILYLVVDISVLRKEEPLEAGLRVLPIFYFFCIAFNTFTISYQGSKILGLESIPLWLAIFISLLTAILAALVVHFVLKPRLTTHSLPGNNYITIPLENDKKDRKQICRSISELPEKYQGNEFNGNNKLRKNRNRGVSEAESVLSVTNYVPQKLELSPRGFLNWLLPAHDRKEDAKTLQLFSSIQVFTACFAGFAHGSNDVSNAIAPLTAMLAIYREMSVQQEEPTPIYVLLYGVFAMCVGLCVLGHKVIKTVGQRMSSIHAASGFTIEFGAAVTALLASKAGLPISTTHCLVSLIKETEL
uniref:Phosphate transporter n=1 Tax=Meloidogyne javanica TaxID=6303 RepID=A0A915M0G3_MELJA